MKENTLNPEVIMLSSIIRKFSVEPMETPEIDKIIGYCLNVWYDDRNSRIYFTHTCGTEKQFKKIFRNLFIFFDSKGVEVLFGEPNTDELKTCKRIFENYMN